MRSAKWSGLLVVLVFFALPAPALAWFGWLDNLSGPGPFIGEEVELRLWCFKGDTPSTVDSLDARFNNACLLRPQRNHRFSIDFIGGGYIATSNRLTYLQPDVNRRVTLVNFGTALSFVTAERFVEGHISVEGNRFFGPAFGGFTRLSIGAFADVKPFKDSNTILKFISIRGGVLMFPGGFDSADFGAVPGIRPLDTDSELIPVFGIVIDYGGRL